MKKPDAWLCEEYDSQGNLVWYGLMQTKPSELSYLNDLKSKLHNLVLIPLYRNEKEVEKVTNVKRYNSKQMAEAHNGL